MSIENVINTLSNLSDIHEELLLLAREKQRSVIDNRVDQLMTFTAKESKAISSMEQLNRDITQYSIQCWKDLGLNAKPASTLADLIQAFPRADQKSALMLAGDRLKEQVRLLKEQNDRNQQLVRQSLEFIDFQIDLLSAPYDEDMTYSPKRPVNAGTPRRTFDTRA
ncbi:flagellar protein FlgN [Cohnella sp. WQ 127256]|uniref:flagellar protein FlgN n=1 Tax=Cohnella sp. WQ 127256 TaxID=2938790 RepID=UPI0021184E56|nr:flagellar protein FlgN [Cohnella sp. WQ 127256]